MKNVKERISWKIYSSQRKEHCGVDVEEGKDFSENDEGEMKGVSRIE